MDDKTRRYYAMWYDELKLFIDYHTKNHLKEDVMEERICSAYASCSIKECNHKSVHVCECEYMHKPMGCYSHQDEKVSSCIVVKENDYE